MLDFIYENAYTVDLIIVGIHKTLVKDTRIFNNRDFCWISFRKPHIPDFGRNKQDTYPRTRQFKWEHNDFHNVIKCIQENDFS